MTNKNLLLSILKQAFFLITVSFANIINGEISQLSEIHQFNEKELSIIEKRYPEFKKNKQLFSPFEFMEISKKNLAPILADIITHPHIICFDTDTLISFAKQIQLSGFTFFDLEKRMVKYLDQGELLFPALRKAVERIHFHRFKIAQNEAVKKEQHVLVQNILKLKLEEYDQDKVINAYATCIDSFNNPEYRQQFMTARICNPLKNYKQPNYEKSSIAVRERPSTIESKEMIAYRILIAQAKRVSERQNLNGFEKIMMAKCIAEQALQYFIPGHHLCKALKKNRAMKKNTAEEAYFAKTGVCGNFSHIAYNIARQIGMKNKVFLARHGVHVYLEFQEDDAWYHAHPFNSLGNCDVIKF